jgi:heme-degrading monooxygenase HmoA
VTVLTVFRSRLAAGAYDAGYGEVAAAMEARARTMPGFVSFKYFAAEDGERVSVIEFDTAEHQAAWARDEEHLTAQQAGRTSFYDEYRITIADVTRDRSWQRPE